MSEEIIDTMDESETFIEYDENESNPKKDKLQKNSRIHLRSAFDAMQPREPIKWIVEDLIPEDSVTMLYGEPGIGKTWVLLSLAVHVAEGKDWLGFKIPKASTVLIIDEESGERRLLNRLNITLNGEGGSKDTPIYTNSLSSFKLDMESEVKTIFQVAKQVNAKLIIIDSLSASSDGEENAKKDMQEVFNNLRKLAFYAECAVVIIHHSTKSKGKKTGNYRGSSAIGGAADLVIKMETKNHNIKFATEKTRDIYFTEWAAEMVWEGERFFLEPDNSFCNIDKSENNSRNNKETGLPSGQKHVLDYLRIHGDSSRTDIANAAEGCSIETARKAIDKLSSLNRIKRINSDQKNKPAIYTLVE
jgi:KaiC/GvpD/RAD55 family RecA-like ATPase